MARFSQRRLGIGTPAAGLPWRCPGAFHRRAFTLLEMIMVMTMIAILVTSAALAISSMAKDEILRQSAQRLRVFAKTAQREAFVERRAHHLVMTSTNFYLIPAEDPDDIKLEYFLPEGVGYRIRFRVDPDWRQPAGDIWSFQPAGLCEPLVVQFNRADAWIELEFDPLTGSVTREEFHLP